MGNFEVLEATSSITLLGIIVFNVIAVLSFKDLLRRFGFMKNARRDFYECGFRPQNQRPIKVSPTFLLISVFFLMYDIELVFLFPLISGIIFDGLQSFQLVNLFFGVFTLSLGVDYERHALY